MGNSACSFCRHFCWCCWSPSEDFDVHWFERGRRREFPHASATVSGLVSRRETFSYVCDICGVVLDPVLLDGHRETCRTRHRQQMQRQRHSLEAGASRGSIEDDSDMCLVCLDAPRVYAFLPCGHVSCCAECAKPLDSCPLCREPRRALCAVAKDTILQQFRCPHCTCIIAPTLFDGHREVCSLRTRETHVLPSPDEDISSPAACDTAAPVGDVSTAVSEQTRCSTNLSDCLKDPTTSSTNSALVIRPTGILKLCLECHGTESPLVFFLPCGHRVLCHNCGIKRVTCPLCLRDVESVEASFT